MQFDPFRGGAGQPYSPENFYTTAKENGQPAKTVKFDGISRAVPETVWNEMSALVASGYFPELRTNNDILRDALTHRVHQLIDLYGDRGQNRRLSYMAYLLKHTSLIAAEVTRQREARQLVAEVRMLVADAQTPAQRIRAKELVSDALDELDDDPWLVEQLENQARML